MMIELKNFCEFLDSKINTSEIEKKKKKHMFQLKICFRIKLGYA